jgi:hypothetical protein
MKKAAHLMILAVFSVACWFLWGILHLAPAVAHGGSAPQFTLLCVGLRPGLIALPILAAAYCLWVMFRKADKLPSWMPFFATTMSVLVLITLPTLVAAYLPLVSSINQLARK